MRLRVGIVRGRWVNRSELANYEPIADRHDLTLIGSIGTSYDGPLPYQTYPSAASVPTTVGRKAARAAIGRLTGAESHLFGLTDDLASYDVVHTAETRNGFSKQAVKAKHAHDIAVVCTVWENIPFLSEDGHYSSGPLERIAWADATNIKSNVRRETDAFLAVTEQARFALETEGVDSGRIHVVPIGVDHETFRPGRIAEADMGPQSFGLSPEAINVVYVGRTPWEKGVYDLLSAWKAVESRVDSRVALTVVGAGENRDRLREYSRYVGLSNVTIRPPVPYEDVPLVMDAADILVLPSLPSRKWQEQYGRVILEAQACETAVVASDTGGIPEAMGGVGRLVRPGDAADIASTVTSLANDDEKRMALAREGRERIERERTLEDTARRVAEIYDMVV